MMISTIYKEDIIYIKKLKKKLNILQHKFLFIIKSSFLTAIYLNFYNKPESKSLIAIFAISSSETVSTY